MKQPNNIIIVLFMGLALMGCKRYDQDYKSDFLKNKENVYPGLASNLHYYPGNLRVELVWHPSPDPTISNYVVKWNNGMDSTIVPATTQNPADSISVVIPNLKEYVYSFKLIAKDKDGNSSIGQSIDNVRVYGNAFAANLSNRPPDPAKPYVYNNDGSVSINFIKADSNNVSTVIKYTDNTGAARQKTVAAKDNSVMISDLKFGTPITYQSTYVPVKNAIDDFFVPDADDFPIIYEIAEVNKSKMTAVHLPSDVSSAYGWELPYLWDKSTNEPGFHTPGQNFPIWFTIDLGNPTELARLKLWQRTSGLYNYGNPKVFEIWGTNNPNSNGDYSGWTKLASFTSVKPSGLPTGQNSTEDANFAAQGESFTFPPGGAPVRYIRFKIFQTWGNTNYFHALEITLFAPVK
ncbi:hypothetical protein GWR56_15310 [Mucilaginibacter sp. 14171R-50]|uniref:DUF4998 domain-containing protein n=1 Tax=Mucilaginibacter sp. 14171R-50 TaxID=2703789 RepID=UPI00138B9A37|nr:DUF4998 domain-containing protein [Mucilaginibacter sp. 14171R-50]QHS56844.1 hypothetical protein GWR56_15310 [Mucilaginibacter sp. 14171R-50]